MNEKSENFQVRMRYKDCKKIYHEFFCPFTHSIGFHNRHFVYFPPYKPHSTHSTLFKKLHSTVTKSINLVSEL